jgi:hypothetical protein
MTQGTKVEARPVPQTHAQLEALQLSRVELHSQLANVNQMRTNLLQQIAMTEQGSVRAELQARLNALNARSGRLEAQLLAADDAISAAIAQGVAGAADVARAAPAPPVAAPPPLPGVPGLPGQEASTTVPDHEFHDVVDSIEGSVAAGITAAIFSFIIISTFFYRMARKRTRQLFETLAADQARRFEQLQQAIDVVAVETERISEGQRFVNKRVNELGAGEAQPVGGQRAAPETVRRDQR